MTVDDLELRIDALERRCAELQISLTQALRDSQYGAGPHKFVLVAEDDGDGWTELTANTTTGEIVDFEDGRSDDEAPIELEDGQFVLLEIEGNPSKYVRIFGGESQADEHDIVGVLAEGDEAAMSDLWTCVMDGGDPEEGTDLQLRITTRVGYFHGGDGKLYGYARQLNFDQNGRLRSLTAETRYEIDAPTACS
jgi:hypothetical protein